MHYTYIIDSNILASTHACVEFFDGKKSAVPLSCLSTTESGKSVRVGDEVEVKWTDGKKYTAAVTALGPVHGNVVIDVISLLLLQGGGSKWMLCWPH